MPNQIQASTELRGNFVHVEPGDATRYEFIVILGCAYFPGIVVTNLDSGQFNTLRLDFPSVVNFFRDVDILENLLNTTYENYSSKAAQLLNHPYVQELTLEAACNPWRTLAALLSIHVTLRRHEMI